MNRQYPPSRSDVRMRQVEESSTPNYWGRYKYHNIHCSRETEQSDWYIWVYTPSGELTYDGYWLDSAGKTISQARDEAIRGASIEGGTR